MGKKAVALIITLWVLVLLSLIGLAFIRTVRVDARISRYHKNNLQALLLAKSGLTVLKADLLQDNNEFDFLSEDWLRKYFYTKEEMEKKGLTETGNLREFEVKDKDGKALGTYSIRVTDEMGKFNINAIDEAMDNMVKYLFDSVQTDNKESLADSVLDWIDPDDLHRLNGAEEEYYRELSAPYHCKNGPLDTLEEMLLIRGITPEIFYGRDGSKGITSFVRIYPAREESVRININTASVEVLRAVLREFGESLPQSILEHRSGRDGVEPSEDDEPFKNAQDMLKLQSVIDAMTGLKEEEKKGYTDRLMKRIDVKTSVFRVESTGRLRDYNIHPVRNTTGAIKDSEISNGARRRITAILRRDTSGLKTIYWREG